MSKSAASDGTGKRWWNTPDTVSELSQLEQMKLGVVYQATGERSAKNENSDRQERESKRLDEFLRPMRGHPVFIVFLRRFGCPVCRAVSTGISYLHDKLLRMYDVNIVAISLEEVGYEEFHKNAYFEGPVFVNEDGSLFSLMKLKRLGLYNGYGMKEVAKVRAATALASLSEFRDTMTWNGDLLQLGGMFLMDETQSKFLFEFREAFAGDTPTLRQLLTALGFLDKAITSHQRIIDELGGLDTKILQMAQRAILEKRRLSSTSMSPVSSGVASQ